MYLHLQKFKHKKRASVDPYKDFTFAHLEIIFLISEDQMDVSSNDTFA